MYDNSYFFQETLSFAPDKPYHLTLNTNFSGSSSLGYSGTFTQTPSSPTHTPGPNFEGSWLDITSDDEEDSVSRHIPLVRMRRKSSDTSAKNVASPSSRNPLSSLRDTFHLRRLTGRTTH
ncbi:hypothetical protein H4S08_004759 [Coemansia sp. RSA 1365]|nr:hypothetical protein H4S08_004759 [Coemansia sp. RSA 1365]